MATVAQNTVTMAQMIEMGEMPAPMPKRLLLQAQFIHRELAVRFAVRAKEFERLPQWAGEEPHIAEVHRTYVDSFRKLRMLPFPTDAAGEAALTALLRDIAARHANVVTSLGRGTQELRRAGALKSQFRVEQMNDFLDRNLRSRIGTVMLTSQHLAMQPEVARAGWVGNINLHCCPREVVADAVADARLLCERVFWDAPEVQVETNLADSDRFRVFPAYIHYICVELLKNAMRATMDRHAGLGAEVPSVRVSIGSDGEGHLGIEVRDMGGGIPVTVQDKVWNYSFTTVKDAEAQGDEALSGSHGLLAGLGFGLPLSRLHARYLGGNLQVVSLPGLSTSAFLHVNTLGNVSEAIGDAYTRNMAFRYDINEQKDYSAAKR